ncbi:hypothetical protein HY449_02170 [Candidatus Pacearchaeota archaeon]|nr:hypothetical protein [Candidatus Pacearchaeota archaeon]
MSLYGLDIMEDSEGKKHLLEINGIRSGMHGFEQIYGDDRVERKVWGMIQEQHGKLTVNDGTLFLKKIIDAHPIAFYVGNFFYKFPFLRKKLLRHPILSSKDAETDWMEDKPENSRLHFPPFERYLGQESTVINFWNEKLEHPLVNDFAAEEIARSKFL